jgi:hypothetical protein
MNTGSCCNPGLFNSSGASQHCDGGVCILEPGTDPSDCDASVVPEEKPDLVITEKYEEWVSQEDKTYNITYTVLNIGDGEAGTSNTSIRIDEVETATDPVPALAAGNSYTNTLGSFTMTGDNDTIEVCADNENAVDESDEANNCRENTFKYHAATVPIPTPSGLVVLVGLLLVVAVMNMKNGKRKG